MRQIKQKQKEKKKKKAKKREIKSVGINYEKGSKVIFLLRRFKKKYFSVLFRSFDYFLIKCNCSLKSF